MSTGILTLSVKTRQKHIILNPPFATAIEIAATLMYAKPSRRVVREGQDWVITGVANPDLILQLIRRTLYESYC
jgi:hypothetical protein